MGNLCVRKYHPKLDCRLEPRQAGYVAHGKCFIFLRNIFCVLLRDTKTVLRNIHVRGMVNVGSSADWGMLFRVKSQFLYLICRILVVLRNRPFLLRCVQHLTVGRLVIASWALAILLPQRLFDLDGMVLRKSVVFAFYDTTFSILVIKVDTIGSPSVC